MGLSGFAHFITQLLLFSKNILPLYPVFLLFLGFCAGRLHLWQLLTGCVVCNLVVVKLIDLLVARLVLVERKDT